MEEHKPVMLDEAIEALCIQPDGIYVDGTFGRGGHARAILAQLGQEGRLIAFDKDPEAVAAAKHGVFEDPRFYIHQGTYAMLQEVISRKGMMGRVSGVLLDLGVSSPQLEEAGRGFSFMAEGPLDMRMDPSTGMDAATWLNSAPDDEIIQVLYEYGEERFARRIVRKIVERRDENPLVTTADLANLICSAVPSRERKKHPATRSFQAIRIFINRELEELEAVLPQCVEVLAPKGRLAVISFHSLEDRLVKRFVRKESQRDVIPKEFLVAQATINPRLLRIGGAIKASEQEVFANPRARSAVLRIAEKQQ